MTEVVYLVLLFFMFIPAYVLMQHEQHDEQERYPLAAASPPRLCPQHAVVRGHHSIVSCRSIRMLADVT